MCTPRKGAQKHGQTPSVQNCQGAAPRKLSTRNRDSGGLRPTGGGPLPRGRHPTSDPGGPGLTPRCRAGGALAMEPESRQPHLQVNLRAKSRAQPSATAPHSSSGRRRAMREAPRNPRRSRPSEAAAAPAGLREPEPLGPPPPPSSSASSLLLLPPPPRPPHSDITCSPSPALYHRCRRLGPGDPAPHVALGPRKQRRRLTRTLHVSDTSGAPRPPPPESAQMHAPPESHAPWDHAPAPTESARVLAALAAASSFHRSLPSCTDCAVCSHSRSAPPPILRLRRRCTLVPDASWRCVLAGPSVRQLFRVLLGLYSSLPKVSEP